MHGTALAGTQGRPHTGRSRTRALENRLPWYGTTGRRAICHRLHSGFRGWRWWRSLINRTRPRLGHDHARLRSLRTRGGRRRNCRSRCRRRLWAGRLRGGHHGRNWRWRHSGGRSRSSSRRSRTGRCNCNRRRGGNRRRGLNWSRRSRRSWSRSKGSNNPWRGHRNRRRCHHRNRWLHRRLHRRRGLRFLHRRRSRTRRRRSRCRGCSGLLLLADNGFQHIAGFRDMREINFGFDLLGRGRRGARRLTWTLPIVRRTTEMPANFLRLVLFERAGMGLFLRDPHFRQHVKNGFAFYFELPGQVVNSNLTHQPLCSSARPR
jgi:hypothetical protein